MTTHYVPVYAPVNGVRLRAICGRYVFPREHSLTPDCGACQGLMAEEAAHDAALGEEPFGPTPPYDAATDAIHAAAARLAIENDELITRTRGGRR